MDEYLSEQRQSGRVESDGVFTLAESVALEKLQEYQVDPPWLGIVKIVQALVRLGAPEIHLYENVTVQAKVEVDIVREDWQSLILADDTPEPLRELALGLWLTLRGCSRIEVRLGHREMTIERNGRSRLYSSHQVNWRLLAIRIYSPHNRLAERLAFLGRHSLVPIGRPGKPEDWRPPVRAELGISGDYPLLEVTVRSENPGLVWEPRLPAVLQIGDPTRPASALMRACANSPDGGFLSVIRAGMECTPIRVDWAIPGAQVWVTADGLNFDLSGLEVIQDQALRDKIDFLGNEMSWGVEQALTSHPRAGPFEVDWVRYSLYWFGTALGGLLGFPGLEVRDSFGYRQGVWSQKQIDSLRDLLRTWQARPKASCLPPAGRHDSHRMGDTPKAELPPPSGEA